VAIPAAGDKAQADLRPAPGPWRKNTPRMPADVGPRWL